VKKIELFTELQARQIELLSVIEERHIHCSRLHLSLYMQLLERLRSRPLQDTSKVFQPSQANEVSSYLSTYWAQLKGVDVAIVHILTVQIA
jgi:hypothetical protein